MAVRFGLVIVIVALLALTSRFTGERASLSWTSGAANTAADNRF
jgi:hypothetical protein